VTSADPSKCPLTLAAKVGDDMQACRWSEPPLTSCRLHDLTTEMLYDLRRLESAAGRLPFGLAEGVRATISRMRLRG
jgi:hypothetical protein